MGVAVPGAANLVEGERGRRLALHLDFHDGHHGRFDGDRRDGQQGDRASLRADPQQARVLLAAGELGLLRFIPGRDGLDVAPHHRRDGDFALIEAPQAVVGNGASARRAPASLASIVFVGNRRTVLMLHEDVDVDAYKRAIGRITEVSLPPDRSAAFVAELINRMERNRGH